jgi:polysaccharide biosynthesis protein PslH
VSAVSKRLGIAFFESTPPLSSLNSEASRAVPDYRRLHVLVLDEEVPYPLDSGKRIRTWNLLCRLARRHRVSLLCYGSPGSPSVVAAENAGIRIHLVPPPASFTNSNLYLRLFFNLFSPYPYPVDKHFSSAFESRLKQLMTGERIDLVHCEWTPYARFRGAVANRPFLITAHNVESQIWFRRSQQSRCIFHRLFFGLQAAKMKRFECRALRSANRVAAVTPEDEQVMRLWGVRSVSLVENGVDLDYFSKSVEIRSAPELLFLGSLDWYPNIDAFNYLVKTIMPIVHSQRPRTRLRVVGRRPSKELADHIAGLEWAELAADVSDVRPYLTESSLVVVPLRIGGGSRIKILESFASGKALISTSVGAEGLKVVPGEHLEIADEPAEFARQILRLLESPGERERLGTKGRELVAEHYGWDRIVRALESAWYEACTPATADGLGRATASNTGTVIP